MADLPEGLQAILRRALARTPAERYATAEEVARLFTGASARRDIAEPAEGGIYPPCLHAHELAPGSDERRA